MRLWHTQIITLLPRQQMLGLWIELNSIYKLQNRHILINFVYDYSKEHLLVYSNIVIKEMLKRGYKINLDNYNNYFKNINKNINMSNPFPNKMTYDYLRQCYYNLEEKFMCKGISEDDFYKIEKCFKSR